MPKWNYHEIIILICMYIFLGWVQHRISSIPLEKSKPWLEIILYENWSPTSLLYSITKYHISLRKYDRVISKPTNITAYTLSVTLKINHLGKSYTQCHVIVQRYILLEEVQSAKTQIYCIFSSCVTCQIFHSGLSLFFLSINESLLGTKYSV